MPCNGCSTRTIAYGIPVANTVVTSTAESITGVTSVLTETSFAQSDSLSTGRKSGKAPVIHLSTFAALKTGAIVIASYALPAVLITAKSLFAALVKADAILSSLVELSSRYAEDHTLPMGELAEDDPGEYRAQSVEQEVQSRGDLLAHLDAERVLSLAPILVNVAEVHDKDVRPVAFSDLFADATTSSSGFYADKQIWALLASFYCFEQARIFVMHLSDIDKDRSEGKNPEDEVVASAKRSENATGRTVAV
jgi:hypothetical protein